MRLQERSTIHQMIDRNFRRTLAAKRGDDTVPVLSRCAERVGHADDAMAIGRAARAGRRLNQPGATYLGTTLRQLLAQDRERTNGLVGSTLIVACLTLGLGACTHPVDCSGGNYRGGCLPGTPDLAAASPVVASPAAVSPGAVSPAVSGPAAVGRGDPAAFADVDDKQCRSYGLIFGSHDYADCRIRLSAQHRGLDPNTSVTTPGPASR
jgi:hypothetical protein